MFILITIYLFGPTTLTEGCDSHFSIVWTILPEHVKSKYKKILYYILQEIHIYIFLIIHLQMSATWQVKKKVFFFF